MSPCVHLKRLWTCKVPRSLLHDKYRSESVYPHNFRLVAFGKRSYVEWRRNYIAWGSIAIKDFHDNLIGSISFHFVQTHGLAWVTALTVLCPSSNILILTSSLTMFLFPFGPTLENTLLLVLPSPVRLVWVMPLMSLIRRLHSASLTADHFIPDFISGYAFWMISSAGSFMIMGRRTFPILNSSASADIGSCRFLELVYKPTFEKQRRSLSHRTCWYTVESAQREIVQSLTSVRATKDVVADHVGNTKPSSFLVDKFFQLM